jgi:hypothetical protein
MRWKPNAPHPNRKHQHRTTAAAASMREKKNIRLLK